MMEIILKNKELTAAGEFLNKMELTATDSRHRSKVLTKLNEAIQSLGESDLELATRYGKLDENKRLIVQEDGSFDLNSTEDKATYMEERAILLNEEVVIQAGMYEKNFAEFSRVLSEYNGIISGESALIYDRLFDEFEMNDKEKD
ncbi:TPA: DUF1617 family protein [Enterococcus faecalis]